jgi:hypothetical protein
MRRDYPPGFITKIGPETGKKAGKVPLDKGITLPADVQATVARGEAAFQSSKSRASRRKQLQRRTTTVTKNDAGVLSFVTSVVDADIQERRDSALKAKAKQSKGKRGQPPRLDRLQAVQTVVDRLLAEGVQFGTCRDSQMNRLVREWLNDKAASSRDLAKSRTKQVTADAVRDILKQIK